MTKLIKNDFALKIMPDCDSIGIDEKVPFDNKITMTRVRNGAVKRFALIGSPSRLRRTFAAIL